MLRHSLFTVLEKNTGLPVRGEVKRAERQTLADQTQSIADALEREGFSPYRKPSADTWTMIGICSGRTETVVPFRNINILPSVASANRSQLLRQMDFWAETQDQHLRYSVVTGGARCPLDELRVRMCKLAREVSDFAADPVLKRLGIEIVFRGSELTLRREADGEVSCHPHANVVTQFSRRLATEEFREYLALGHAHFSGHWQECGRLVKTNEVIKYPTKPCEVSMLTGKELVRLAVALHGLHLMQSMGGFRDLRHDLDESREKISKVCTDEEQGTFAWCRVPRASRPESAPAENPDRENVILAILPPQPRFVDALEPVILVQNFNGDITQAVEKAGLGDALARALEVWIERSELRALAFTPSRQLLPQPIDPVVWHDPDELFAEERAYC